MKYNTATYVKRNINRNWTNTKGDYPFFGFSTKIYYPDNCEYFVCSLEEWSTFYAYPQKVDHSSRKRTIYLCMRVKQFFYQIFFSEMQYKARVDCPLTCHRDWFIVAEYCKFKLLVAQGKKYAKLCVVHVYTKSKFSFLLFGNILYFKGNERISISRFLV